MQHFVVCGLLYFQIGILDESQPLHHTHCTIDRDTETSVSSSTRGAVYTGYCTVLVVL